MDFAGLVGIFLSLAIENIGVPFPIELAYVWAANMVRNGYPYALMLLILTAGHMTGAVVAFQLGRLSEHWLAKRLQNSDSYQRASTRIHEWFVRYGPITVFAARFIGYVRPWSSLVAGYAGLEWRPFLVWTITGTLVFNFIALELNLYFVDLWHKIGPLLKIGFLILLVLSFSVIFLIRWHHRRLEDRSGKRHNMDNDN